MTISTLPQSGRSALPLIQPAVRRRTDDGHVRLIVMRRRVDRLLERDRGRQVPRIMVVIARAAAYRNAVGVGR